MGIRVRQAATPSPPRGKAEAAPARRAADPGATAVVAGPGGETAAPARAASTAPRRGSPRARSRRAAVARAVRVATEAGLVLEPTAPTELPGSPAAVREETVRSAVGAARVVVAAAARAA